MWLVLSDVIKRLFCKYCPRFTHRNQGGYGGNTPLVVLVTQPLTDRNSFSINIYCKNKMATWKDFVRDYHNPQWSDLNLLDENQLWQKQENIKRLIPIVKIFPLGKQNIPLRGHKVDGDIRKNKTQNEGNFRDLLRFRIHSGDKTLGHHLGSTSSRCARAEFYLIV